jgi:glycosyltransferase involved in cell wall biosynthesis
MAMKVPNVVSPPVAAAIGGIHRKHLLVAGTDREFVELLLELLDNHELREYITENAFELVGTEFTWQKVNQKFDPFFQY